MFWSEFKEGFSLLRHNPALRANTTMVLVSVAGLGAVYPLAFFFAVNVLDGGAGTYGALEAVTSVGFLVGSLALVVLASRVHQGRVMIGGLIAMGACLALVALADSVWVAAIPFALFGIANAVALIAVDTFLQQAVPEGTRGPRDRHTVHADPGDIRALSAGRRRAGRRSGRARALRGRPAPSWSPPALSGSLHARSAAPRVAPGLPHGPGRASPSRLAVALPLLGDSLRRDFVGDGRSGAGRLSPTDDPGEP